MEYKEVYESWLANPYFDEATKQELLSIKDDENEIKERFYADLEFGTAGLRGVIGAGTNRMNVYVVRKTTQGLANYIIKQNAADKGVAIAFDSRRMSTEFANEAALCLAANGIKAYIFDALRPTPELSFAVRYLACTAGINITASHNPPEYNGYKVYWADGAQITPPHDSGIMAEVKAVTDYNEVKTMDRDQAFDQIHIVILRNGIRHVGCNNCLDQCAVFRQSLFLLDLADCVICQKTAGHIACQRMVNTFSVLHSDTETVCIRICCKNKICIYFLRQL